MTDPLDGLTVLRMPNALQRTLASALGAVRPPEIWAPPEIKETPLDHLHAIQNAHPVPHEWEVSLREVSPISQTMSWLAFRWADGIPGEPIERWMLYECIPQMSAEWRFYLGGTPWWELPTSQQPGRRQLVSTYQWAMYRKHRVWARPFWCLQGTDGGTPCAYSELEQKLLRLVEQPTDPPLYGSLPYAPWDARVEARVRERDALWKLGHAITRFTEQGVAEHLKAMTAEAERQFRIKFLAWIAERFAPQVDFLDWYSRQSEADRTLRQATDAQVRAAEEHEERFVTRDEVPAPREGPLAPH
jgi:hypothetical protein